VNDVTERLKELIRTGDLEPGQRLQQIALANLLGVSRTPVREALVRLEHEGLVVMSPGRGHMVMSLTIQDIEQIQELRLIVEPAAARLAVTRASAGQISRLLACQNRHEALSDSDQAHPDVALEVHRLLLAPCQNRLMMQTLELAWSHTENRRAFEEQVPARISGSQLVHDHRQIVDAFAQRDADAVERLMRLHIADQRSDHHC
jgi:DNA-binding GntR family transcriptional regulator